LADEIEYCFGSIDRFSAGNRSVWMDGAGTRRRPWRIPDLASKREKRGAAGQTESQKVQTKPQPHAEKNR